MAKPHSTDSERQAARERDNERKRLWRLANLERVREYHREYAKRWRRRHPERSKELSQRSLEWQRRNPVWHARNTYKRRAKIKGFAYELTDSEFEALVLGRCHYCGREASGVNGIDRIDSSGGYILGNVVTACGQCNIAKNDYSLAEFREWVLRVARRLEEIKDGCIPEI